MSFGGGGGGGVAARSGSGSSRWCSAFWSAVDAGIWSVVAWGGWAPAVPWVAGGLVGAGPWLQKGVGWPGGRRSRRPSSGLQRTSCQGKRGGHVAERCAIGWATRAGGGVLGLPFCSPRALTLGGWW